jgi:hypothetical protein
VEKKHPRTLIVATISTIVALVAMSSLFFGCDNPSSDSSASGSSTVSATVSVTGVALSPTTLSLTVGGSTGSLTATVSPSTATDPSVSWSTSDASVATVSGGVVTPVAVGTATITVKTTDGSYTATCAVTVAGNVSGISNLTVTKTKDMPTKLTIKFVGINDGTTSLKYYQVYYRAVGASSYEVSANNYATQDNYEIVITGLTANTPYEWYVQLKEFGNSTALQTSSVTTTTTLIAYTKPAAVSSVIVKRSDITKNSVKFSWVANPVDTSGNALTITGYEIVNLDTLATIAKVTDTSFTMTEALDSRLTTSSLPGYYIRQIAEETSKQGTSKEFELLPKFASEYKKYIYVFNMLSAITNGNITTYLASGATTNTAAYYNNIATVATTAYTNLTADSNQSDSHVTSTYGSVLSSDQIDAGITLLLSLGYYQGVDRYPVWANNLSSYVKDTDIENEFNVNLVSKAIMPAKSKGIIENFEAYRNAELALMPMEQRKKLLEGEVYTV